jgi:cell division protein FtsB
MMDWVAGAVASAKTMGDIAKSLLTIRDESVIKARVFELNSTLMDLQQQIMAAQREQMALLDEVSELKKDLRHSQQSLSDQQDRLQVLDRYELLNVGPGKVIYQLKPVLRNEEPEHFCCTNCYDGGRRSVMTGSHHAGDGFLSFFCPSCKYSIRVQNCYVPDAMLCAD